MLTNDLSNSNTPSSAPPPPPPPPPANWEKNRKPAKNNDKDGKSPSVTAEKSSSGNKPRRDQSKSPVQQSSLNFAENPLFKKKQEEHNVNSETADEGSKNSIHVKNPEIALNHKEEDNASDKTKNDRSNTKQVMPKKPMTEQHNGVHSDSENQKSSVAEQKKATGLKYSIAILLLCTSSTVAGVYTCFIILEVLSSAAVPVSSAVIAFVSASVMLSLAAYLINSHLSAINSEKGVDPGRKQSQDLQKAKGLEHSNTHTSSLSVTLGTSSAPPPPPPPLPQNAAPLPSPPTASKYTEKPKNCAPKNANESEHDRSALFAQIREGVILKPVPKDGLKIPQKQEEESVAEKQESDVQSRNKEVHQIRKVENQKTDKEQNNSESIQQGNYMNEGLKSKVLKQRNKSGFQDEELDSLDKQDDSLCSLEESLIEPNNTSNKELKKPVQPLNLSIVLKNIMSSENPLLNSPSNNLLSNSSNVSDDEEWDTSQDSMSFQPQLWISR
ncbi:hypothetical protein C1A_943 [Wolbachia endosymbiont of Culex quinquefasciatus JHB]|uniref:WH2 domain-containing protein n=2 Tax=unclassified Wolbachia TaxID=2640676 RepID=UPI0001848532|nr:WH2 domain-containing protein [Wolbachia endosymbiont of Culex quinquefasciatus]EEB55921.1 hypothetical protein C1A_943 [Wolbachia endosymbiont of Culex quinquefasciatus JHB]